MDTNTKWGLNTNTITKQGLYLSSLSSHPISQSNVQPVLKYNTDQNIHIYRHNTKLHLHQINHQILNLHSSYLPFPSYVLVNSVVQWASKYNANKDTHFCIQIQVRNISSNLLIVTIECMYMFGWTVNQRWRCFVWKN